MSIIRAALLSGAALLAATSVVSAADLFGRGGSLKDPGYAPAALTSPHRWYARIDGSYAGYDDPNSVFNYHGVQTEVTRTHIESGWGLGGGLGMYFSRNVRGDITYTHFFDRAFSGHFNVEVPAVGGGSTTENVRAVNNMRSDLILASVYYDFDLRSHFTPYIGLGLGAVNHSVKAGSFRSADGYVTGTTAAYDNWHVAGAVMAGFSVALRERLHLDAGYRFLYLGETSTGALRITTPPTPVTGKDPTIENIHGHEFRFGLRYDIH